MANVSEADRAAARSPAHHLVGRVGGCFVINGRHSDHCDAATEVVAQAIAVRVEEENRACEAVAEEAGEAGLDPFDVASHIAARRTS